MTSAPALQFTSPADEQHYYVDYAAPVAVQVDLALAVTQFAMGPGGGQIICHINGKAPLLATTTGTLTAVDLGTAKGVRVISCTLADAAGQLLPGVAATANLHLYISQDPLKTDAANTCTADTDCTDPMGCTQYACVGGKCIYNYTLAAQCCSTAFECPAGVICSGTKLTAKCSLCQSSSACDDGNPCTIDTCNQATGLCTYTFNGDSTCCLVSSDCNDLDPATDDWCDAAHTCKYKPASDGGADDAPSDTSAWIDAEVAEGQAGDVGEAADAPSDVDSALAEDAGPDASPDVSPDVSPDAGQATDTANEIADVADISPASDSASRGKDSADATGAITDAAACDAADGCALAALDTCAGDTATCHPQSKSSPTAPTDGGCSASRGGSALGFGAWLLWAAGALAIGWRRRSGRAAT